MPSNRSQIAVKIAVCDAGSTRQTASWRGLWLCGLGLADLDPVGFGRRALAEELDPLLLEARIAESGLDQVEKAAEREVEPLLQLLALQGSALVERLMALGEREHVGVDARAEVFQRDAQRPESAVAANHGRRRRHEKGLLAVERLGLKA